MPVNNVNPAVATVDPRDRVIVAPDLDNVCAGTPL